MPSRTPTSDKNPAAQARVAGLNVRDDDPEATQTLAAVDTTQPLDQRGNGRAMVPARNGGTTQLAGEAAVKLARVAEQQQFALTYAAEAGRRAELIALLVEADDWAADRKLAPADLLERFTTELSRWRKDRGAAS